MCCRQVYGDWPSWETNCFAWADLSKTQFQSLISGASKDDDIGERDQVREIRDKEREKENEISQGDDQESTAPVNEYTEEVYKNLIKHGEYNYR